MGTIFSIKIDEENDNLDSKYYYNNITHLSYKTDNPILKNNTNSNFT